jgi:hypothetical protein
MEHSCDHGNGPSDSLKAGSFLTRSASIKFQEIPYYIYLFREKQVISASLLQKIPK